VSNASRVRVIEESHATELRFQHEQRLRHDLRQSLGAVMALVAIIERIPQMSPVALERLDQIQREADWMAKILATGDTERAQVQVVDIGDAVSESWAVVAAYAPCSVRLVRESAAHAIVDPVALRRSARNLIENAVRAAGPRGSVEVRVLAGGGGVLIEVADSGPGFGNVPAQQGLGLVTVRRFASRWGGSLTVGTSELGGALVTLTLPNAPMNLDLNGGAAS